MSNMISTVCLNVLKKSTLGINRDSDWNFHWHSGECQGKVREFFLPIQWQTWWLFDCDETYKGPYVGKWILLYVLFPYYEQITSMTPYFQAITTDLHVYLQGHSVKTIKLLKYGTFHYVCSTARTVLDRYFQYVSKLHFNAATSILKSGPI